MTVAQHPKVLLLDEPTTYLDIAHQLEVMELVKDLNHKYNMTVIMVLHDINQAAQNSERLIVLKKGKYIMMVHHIMYYVKKCSNQFLILMLKFIYKVENQYLPR